MPVRGRGGNSLPTAGWITDEFVSFSFALSFKPYGYKVLNFLIHSSSRAFLILSISGSTSPDESYPLPGSFSVRGTESDSHCKLPYNDVSRAHNPVLLSDVRLCVRGTPALFLRHIARRKKDKYKGRLCSVNDNLDFHWYG